MRKLAPRETLVYLETNDVGEMLESLTASPAFQTLAKDKQEFSALKNIQIAVAVTGFETSEENSVLNLKPRFVAIAETHAWNWQTVSLVENQIDNFVRKNYGDSAKLETVDKNDGKFFTWTANDNRRVFALAQNSLIYFGNDASAIEKCLAVKKGEAESLAQNESFTRVAAENNLASGYVSTDGVRQIANLAGVSVAVNASEEIDERSFIARIVPQILQNTTREIVWTANRVERGIEDKFSVNLMDETAFVLKKTLNSKTDSLTNFADFLPSDTFAATFYNLKNPLISWRGSLALTAKNTDALSGKILIEFSDKLLEPYGIADAETFLGAVDAPIITAQFDADGEKSVSIAAVKDLGKLKAAISKEIDFESPPEKRSGAEVWFSANRGLAAAFIEIKLILGDGESVLKCLQAKVRGQSLAKNSAFQAFAESRAVAATFGKDADSAEKIAAVLANAKDEHRKLATFYTTETRLTESGFERVTVSDFGLIGTILENLN
ncbi:MAG: hypothetical protein LH472_06150 [Pyrinomonadaceae bacterium]|nr:hypothetical protein [Pyrinomonadaceae bacterium]